MYIFIFIVYLCITKNVFNHYVNMLTFLLIIHISFFNGEKLLELFVNLNELQPICRNTNKKTSIFLKYRQQLIAS